MSTASPDRLESTARICFSWPGFTFKNTLSSFLTPSRAPFLREAAGFSDSVCVVISCVFISFILFLRDRISLMVSVSAKNQLRPERPCPGYGLGSSFVAVPPTGQTPALSQASLRPFHPPVRFTTDTFYLLIRPPTN